MFFLIKRVRLSVWQIKGINISGRVLTNINFTNTGSQVTFISTMKYYLTSLEKLASTIGEFENKNVEKVVI